MKLKKKLKKKLSKTNYYVVMAIVLLIGLIVLACGIGMLVLLTVQNY